MYAFVQSSAAMRSDRGVGFFALLVAMALLATAWVAWLVGGRVALYETTSRGRVEVIAQAHQVQSPLQGRILEADVALGQVVHAGDVLVRLDVESTRRLLEVEQARSSALARRRVALLARIDAERQAAQQSTQVYRASRSVAAAHRAEAQARSRSTGDHAHRVAQLTRAGAAAPADAILASEEALRERSTVDAANAELVRLQSDHETGLLDRGARIASLQQDLAEIDGQLEIGTATAQRLAYEVALGEIRAPVDGRVGDLASLQVGGVVQAGAPICSIVPLSALRVVALFSQGEVVGRVRRGQRGQMRFDGFPSSEFGAARAHVVSVATEARDGQIRVELVLDPPTPAGIPVQHGLTGAVEIETEHARPIDLALRLVGRVLHAPASSSGAGL